MPTSNAESPPTLILRRHCTRKRHHRVLWFSDPKAPSQPMQMEAWKQVSKKKQLKASITNRSFVITDKRAIPNAFYQQWQDGISHRHTANCSIVYWSRLCFSSLYIFELISPKFVIVKKRQGFLLPEPGGKMDGSFVSCSRLRIFWSCCYLNFVFSAMKSKYNYEGRMRTSNKNEISVQWLEEPFTVPQCWTSFPHWI